MLSSYRNNGGTGRPRINDSISLEARFRSLTKCRWKPGITTDPSCMKLHRELTDLLAKIGPPGAFATRTTAAPEALRLEVRGVGPVRLPVTRARGRRLCGIARPARYGLGDRTLLDPGVRDTWEIARSRVKIDQRKWKQTLLPELERIRRGLRLPEECRLSAELHNMLGLRAGPVLSPPPGHREAGRHDRQPRRPPPFGSQGRLDPGAASRREGELQGLAREADPHRLLRRLPYTRCGR